MKVAIVTTGHELLRGTTVDTNTTWLADRCFAAGSEVMWHVTVRDVVSDIVDALQTASERTRCVIVTGGLGPTVDDITLSAATTLVGEKLVKNATTLANTVGTAPGVHVEWKNVHLFFLPGVPKEMKPMYESCVHPWLVAHADAKVSEVILRCFGMREAVIDEKIRDVNITGAELSFRVKFPEVLVKVLARSVDETKARTLVSRIAADIRKRLGDVVYGEGEEDLAQVVGKLLTQKKMTLAVAESCTGGSFSNFITDIPGASTYFERGVVSYSNRSKMELLDVKENTLATHGAVSAEVAKEMAEGVRRKSKTSLGVSITGIAGPAGGTKEKPVGTVFIGSASEKGVTVTQLFFPGDRASFKELVSWTALDMIRKHLLHP